MEYGFYGADDCDVRPINNEYPDINNPKDLYDALSDIWCAETCAPRMRKDWSKENKTLGQCSITAFLCQDIFGGNVYGVPLGDGNYHCYNIVDGKRFDLTSEQFEHKLIYKYEYEQFREEHFSKQEKYERYLYLKEALKKRQEK